MPSCPNCSYELVLLEHRRKYKCAKCGRLFPQKEIEMKEFREWNKKQRQLEKEKIEQEIRERKKPLSEEERKQHAKESAKRWREKNRAKCQTFSQRYYNKHRQGIILKKREYRKKNGQRSNDARKSYRRQNIGAIRHQNRIEYWRQRQKGLALQMLENQFGVNLSVNNNYS